MRRAASSDPRSAEEGQSRLNSRPCQQPAVSLGLCCAGAAGVRGEALRLFVVNSVCCCGSGIFESIDYDGTHSLDKKNRYLRNRPVIRHFS